MGTGNTYTDNDLLRLIAEGDQSAFRELFRRYWPQVYGTGLRLTKSPELAKDLAQDIFLKLWDQRGNLSAVRATDAFLYTLSRNLILDFLRKKVLDSSQSHRLTEYFQYDGASPEEQLDYKETEKLLRAAIEQLPSQLQQVFRLHRLEGLSHDEIAERLHISRVSSKTYIVRALAFIRKYLDEHSDKLIFFFALMSSLVFLSRL